jgi:O-antigen/teichoic acid export membrane protein
MKPNFRFFGWSTLAFIWACSLVSGWARDDVDGALFSLVIFTAIVLAVRWVFVRKKRQ